MNGVRRRLRQHNGQHDGGKKSWSPIATDMAASGACVLFLDPAQTVGSFSGEDSASAAPRKEPPLNDLLLEYVKVVGGCHGDDVVLRMPGGVEDLLVEV